MGKLAIQVAALDQPDLGTRFDAAWHLGRLVEHAEVIVPLVIPHLRSERPLTVEAARWILVELGGEHVFAPLVDAYASSNDIADRAAIATAMSSFGPGAAAACADVLREDARADAMIATALRELVGPWPEAPETVIPYLGEHVGWFEDSAPSREHLGYRLWIEAIEHRLAANPDGEDDWDDPEPETAIGWWPDQIAIARPRLPLALFNFDENVVVTADLLADDGKRFTKLELLAKALAAQHELGPCNDRIFEGIALDDDGAYYLSTGS